MVKIASPHPLPQVAQYVYLRQFPNLAVNSACDGQCLQHARHETTGGAKQVSSCCLAMKAPSKCTGIWMFHFSLTSEY